MARSRAAISARLTQDGIVKMERLIRYLPLNKGDAPLLGARSSRAGIARLHRAGILINDRGAVPATDVLSTDSLTMSE